MPHSYEKVKVRTYLIFGEFVIMNIEKMLCCALVVATVICFGMKIVNVLENKDPNISVIGQAVKTVTSDSASWTIDIVSEGDSYGEVQEQRKLAVKTTKDFLKEYGLDESEIVSETLNMENIFRYGTENAKDKKKYKFTDIILVNTNKIDLLKKILLNIDSLLEKNICIENDHQHIRYFFKDIDKLIAEMTETAVIDARNKAENAVKVEKRNVGSLKSLIVEKAHICSENSSRSGNSDSHWEEERSEKKRIDLNVSAVFNVK
ncbi:MAG: SIMPL domain-containing protein [Holosporales bacterium]|nr:SIMPL domain-containing protein [Holosporales bacterium]